MRRFALPLMTIALISTTLVGVQGQPRLTRQQIMASADKNGDGKIDRIEFLERMREAFFFQMAVARASPAIHLRPSRAAWLRMAAISRARVRWGYASGLISQNGGRCVSR